MRKDCLQIIQLEITAMFYGIVKLSSFFCVNGLFSFFNFFFYVTEFFFEMVSSSSLILILTFNAIFEKVINNFLFNQKQCGIIISIIIRFYSLFPGQPKITIKSIKQSISDHSCQVFPGLKIAITQRKRLSKKVYHSLYSRGKQNVFAQHFSLILA